MSPAAFRTIARVMAWHGMDTIRLTHPLPVRLTLFGQFRIGQELIDGIRRVDEDHLGSRLRGYPMIPVLVIPGVSHCASYDCGVLANPLVDECLPFNGSTVVPDIPQLGLVEAEERDNQFTIRGEPHDDPGGDVWIERVSRPPQFAPARLPHPLEGPTLFLGLAYQLPHRLQKRPERCQPPPSQSITLGHSYLQLGDPGSEAVRPRDLHLFAITLR